MSNYFEMNRIEKIWAKKTPRSLDLEVSIKNLAATYSPNLLRLVPSATRGLTAEFGMGSGVSLSLWPPGKILNHRFCYILIRLKRRLKKTLASLKKKLKSLDRLVLVSLTHRC